MNADLKETGTSLTRPLKVLVPLIKEELDAGDTAGIEHYRKAGEMLLEAKEQVAHGEWKGWVQRNFDRRLTTVRYYMRLAEEVKKTPRRVFTSVRQAVRPDEPSHGPSWQQPVREIASRVNVDALAKERQDREKEQRLLQTLSHQLIGIGYKVLASKLHPDKGGSAEAMARLNKVRDILKGAI